MPQIVETPRVRPITDDWLAAYWPAGEARKTQRMAAKGLGITADGTADRRYADPAAEAGDFALAELLKGINREWTEFFEAIRAAHPDGLREAMQYLIAYAQAARDAMSAFHAAAEARIRDLEELDAEVRDYADMDEIKEQYASEEEQYASEDEQ